ncbi:zinc finger protein 322 isoform X3 [Artibeus jamaicensis]|uniref:zinc finger protein 322 isoform X3 n=1 Tax=Artibeus jamaicensis TaxID=9417 RepID=UPI00235AD097|nr:zinc finger protein 322 isoform X3 [Artibeus jamaicensis]
MGRNCGFQWRVLLAAETECKQRWEKNAIFVGKSKSQDQEVNAASPPLTFQFCQERRDYFLFPGKGLQSLQYKRQTRIFPSYRLRIPSNQLNQLMKFHLGTSILLHSFDSAVPALVDNLG